MPCFSPCYECRHNLARLAWVTTDLPLFYIGIGTSFDSSGYIPGSHPPPTRHDFPQVRQRLLAPACSPLPGIRLSACAAVALAQLHASPPWSTEVSIPDPACLATSERHPSWGYQGGGGRSCWWGSQPHESRLQSYIGDVDLTRRLRSSAKLHSTRCCAWQPQPPFPFLCDHNHRLAVDASRQERTGPSLRNFFISAAWSHN